MSRWSARAALLLPLAGVACRGAPRPPEVPQEPPSSTPTEQRVVPEVSPVSREQHPGGPTAPPKRR